MGITVHEHLIIGDNKYFSFADNGYIEKINREFDMRVSELGAGGMK
jgi:DNA repair protein RadC